MNKYIKLNDNNLHLSLGNLFNTIKKLAINKSSAIQVEIFCIIFNLDNISDTTVNNYCTGYRAINSEYKQIYLNYLKKYPQNKEILLNTINNLLSIIDGIIYNYQTIDEINNNKSIPILCKDLHILAKNDIYVKPTLKKEILSDINKSNYYEALCKMLFFIILEKKQPLYAYEEISKTIDDILENTNLSVNDLKDYLNVKFKEGINLTPSLKELCKKNNPYALLELANLEYTGLISGTPRFNLAYSYCQKAASFDHPTAYWMLSHMIINKKIGSLTADDIALSWTYLKKAEQLNSVSALNSIGICYLHGYTPNKKKDLNKAIAYFNKAASKGYPFAHNNLGKIYEEAKKYEEAFNCYQKSAEKEESWACNKVGEFYRLGLYVKKDLNKAYNYYLTGSVADIFNICPWNIFNLVKYFYYPGNATLGIEKDLNKSINLLNSIPTLEEAQVLLLYIYYEIYLNNKTKDNLANLTNQLSLINNSNILDKKTKKEIENTLKNIKTYHISISI